MRYTSQSLQFCQSSARKAEVQLEFSSPVQRMVSCSTRSGVLATSAYFRPGENTSIAEKKLQSEFQNLQTALFLQTHSNRSQSLRLWGNGAKYQKSHKLSKE